MLKWAMPEKNSTIREISLRFSKREWEFSFKDQNAGGLSLAWHLRRIIQDQK